MLEAKKWNLNLFLKLKQNVYKVHINFINLGFYVGIKYLIDLQQPIHFNSFSGCKGITFEPKSNKWTLRASDIPKKSSKATEMSLLKSCFNQGTLIFLIYSLSEKLLDIY